MHLDHITILSELLITISMALCMNSENVMYYHRHNMVSGFGVDLYLSPNVENSPSTALHASFFELVLIVKHVCLTSS